MLDGQSNQFFFKFCFNGEILSCCVRSAKMQKYSRLIHTEKIPDALIRIKRSKVELFYFILFSLVRLACILFLLLFLFCIDYAEFAIWALEIDRRRKSEKKGKKRKMGKIVYVAMSVHCISFNIVEIQTSLGVNVSYRYIEIVVLKYIWI